MLVLGWNMALMIMALSGSRKNRGLLACSDMEWGRSVEEHLRAGPKFISHWAFWVDQIHSLGVTVSTSSPNHSHACLCVTVPGLAPDTRIPPFTRKLTFDLPLLLLNNTQVYFCLSYYRHVSQTMWLST
jgi:hypothetical protein